VHVLTHGSLFSGIGGFDLGFERAGIETLWQVEKDDYCRAVLCKHWPHVKKYTDIKLIDFRALERVDIVSGGFPCQDVSLAGKRKGLEGDDSGLWFQMWEAICVLQPMFVVVENVAGLLSLGIGRVLGDLARIGYDCEWDCLPAFAFGAEHERRRIFIIAYPHKTRSQIWRITSENKSNEGVLGAGLGFIIGTESSGLERRGAARWSGDVHGIPRRVDRIKALGNAVVPQIAEWIGRKLLLAEGNEA
jgi:DNA (cytosine-5)-methyltransferase 1